MQRTYVVTRKDTKAADREWLGTLHRIPGVHVRGETPDQAVVAADDQEIELLRAQLGEGFLIEEQKRRTLED